jgi:hypothetical protein
VLLGTQRALVAILALALLQGASPAANDEGNALPDLDWNEIANRKVVELITSDPETGEYVAKVWFVVIDGAAYLRTGPTRWLANLRRQHDAVVRVEQQSYGVRAEEIADPAVAKRVEAELKEAYGRLHRMRRNKVQGVPTIVRLGPRC